MKDAPARMLALVCVLLGVWIVTYWVYQPSAGRKVTFDAPPEAAPPRPAVTMDPGPTPPAPEPAPAPTPAPAEPPAVTPAPTPPGPGTAPAPAPTRRVKKVVPPEFKEYVVQKGDVSFERIAARPEVYGDAKRWKAVAQANPFADPGRLKPGQTKLRIPLDPDNVQGKEVWVDEPVAGGPSPAGSPAPAPVQPEAPAVKTYTITGDDTMWGIAERFYGKGAKWRVIYEANKDVIPDPDRPPRGVTIRIPPE
jgi:nucleoid-associated protein YgaU